MMPGLFDSISLYQVHIHRQQKTWLFVFFKGDLGVCIDNFTRTVWIRGASTLPGLLGMGPKHDGDGPLLDLQLQRCSEGP